MFDVKVELTRLEKEIVKFEEEPVETGLVMFYGDSQFTRWTAKWNHRPAEEDLPGKDGRRAVVNRGFGSSTAEEQLYYYPRVVRPWKPKALVLCTGGNDWGKGYTTEEIMTLQMRLCEYARTDFPGIHLFLCCVTPNSKRAENPEKAAKCVELNRLRKEYCDAHEDCTYVDQLQYAPFFSNPSEVGEYKNFRVDLCVPDGHYNQEGYDLYRDFMKEVLKDYL